MTETRGPVCGLLLLAVGLAPGRAAGQGAPRDSVPPDACVSCHEVLPVERLSAPVTAYRDDVHAGLGFGCADCHGGDPSAAGLASMDQAKGFLGRPAGRQILLVCGRCHADAGFMRRYDPAARVDQVAEYGVSVHGQRLLGMGDTRVATCISCHPAHQIRPPDDSRSTVHPTNVATTCGACHADTTYMRGYNIPTNQLELYRTSVHWWALSERGDLSAPTCNDCHGNHGAAPPGVAWVGNVCGQCHTVMEAYFAASRHAPIFARLGVPGCAVCHGNHGITAARDSLLGMGDGAVCARCHVAGQGGGVTAAAMRHAIDSLGASFAVADSLLRRAEHAGMEVSQAQVDLQHAQTSLLLARTAVHTFETDSVDHYVGDGLTVTDTAIARGNEALADLRFRRLGLGLSTGVIVLLIGGLLLKIRQLERRA
jgi:predicted CXXCH cytochrome family protein